MLTRVCTDYSNTYNETQTDWCLCKETLWESRFISWSSGWRYCAVW